MISANSERIAATPTKPNRSPAEANTKSVSLSGRKPSFCWVASSPLPVFPPDPIAALDCRSW
ncbi:unannotated protein [freshwater metagenome]|uniref:Unannotated protein n=1 Tax=freshwater metagenome TaxID=449393 RepID=A0A6J7GVJ5_9ZZZZ